MVRMEGLCNPVFVTLRHEYLILQSYVVHRRKGLSKLTTVEGDFRQVLVGEAMWLWSHTIPAYLTPPWT